MFVQNRNRTFGTLTIDLTVPTGSFEIIFWCIELFCLLRKLLYPTSVSVDSNVELGEVSDCANIDNLDEKFQRLRFTKKGPYNTSGASVVSVAV